MRKASPVSKVLRVGYVASLLLGIVLLALGTALMATPVQAAPAQQGSTARHVDVAVFKLPITPISAQYYSRLIQTAENDGAAALIVQIDTPGGLVDSMQGMVQRTLSAHVPVIAYVSPQGALSASAGVFLVYASHIAVMAPNTTIGSSEVIMSGGGDTVGTPETGDAAAERRKVTNLLVSQIRNLAEHRGRNGDFAEKAVRESANLQSKDALSQGVVDVIALDLNDLLDKVDGRLVELNGVQSAVHTKGAALHSITSNFGEELLFLITNPSVAFVLISLGTLGITWEFINPGSVFPGVVGAIFLLVGFLALGTLPVNWSGAVFLVLAFVLFIADVFLPTHGILTAGGIISLVLGGLLLVNTSAAPGIPGVSPAVVAGTAVGLGAFFFFAVYKVLQARRRLPATGRESLVGKIAQTRTDLAPDGTVFISGELWRASSEDGPIPSGQPVRVVAAEGLRLRVKRDE